jgi:hypothetical protein
MMGRGKHYLIELNSMSLIFLHTVETIRQNLIALLDAYHRYGQLLYLVKQKYIRPEQKENAYSQNMIFRFLTPTQRPCQTL